MIDSLYHATVHGPHSPQPKLLSVCVAQWSIVTRALGTQTRQCRLRQFLTETIPKIFSQLFQHVMNGATRICCARLCGKLVHKNYIKL